MGTIRVQAASKQQNVVTLPRIPFLQYVRPRTEQVIASSAMRHLGPDWLSALQAVTMPC